MKKFGLGLAVLLVGLFGNASTVGPGVAKIVLAQVTAVKLSSVSTGAQVVRYIISATVSFPSKCAAPTSPDDFVRYDAARGDWAQDITLFVKASDRACPFRGPAQESELPRRYNMDVVVTTSSFVTGGRQPLTIPKITVNGVVGTP